MNFLNRVVAKYQVRASDDEETFEMLNSWIFGDPEPLIESFNRGEWRPCGVAPKKLYRTIVLDNVNDLKTGLYALESWSKSEKAAQAFIETERKDIGEGKIVVLLERVISAQDQIINMSETDVDDVYHHEQEVICKRQNVGKADIKKVFKMKNGKLTAF